jgi:hypothetical protein
MIGVTVALALTALGAVSPTAATEHVQLNQLETARVPQPVQRLEFGVEGDSSAFKFRFADPVCFPTSPAACLYGVRARHNVK